MLEKDTKFKLNIGSGYDTKEGFTNIDLEVENENTIKANILDRDSVPIEDGTVSYITMNHVIEHFWENEVPQVLKTCYDLLEKGGTLELTLPDFGLMVKAWNNGDLSIRYISRLIYGWEANYNRRPREMHMMHKIIFDKGTMRQFLEDAGFTYIVIHDETGYSMLDEYPELGMKVTCLKP